MPLTDGLPYKSIAATISEELHAGSQPKLPPPPSPSLSSRLSEGADWAQGQSIARQRDQAAADLNMVRRRRQDQFNAGLAIAREYTRQRAGVDPYAMLQQTRRNAAAADTYNIEQRIAGRPVSQWEPELRAEVLRRNEQAFLATPGTSVEGLVGSPHRTNLQAAAELAGEPFRMIGHYTRKATEPALESTVGRIPRVGEPVAEFGSASVPYLTPGTQLLGLAQLELGVAATLEAYKDGKISEGDLAKELAVQGAPILGAHLAPHVIKLGRAGAGELAAKIRSGEVKLNEQGFESPGALPEIPQTRETAAAGALGEVAQARAEARSMPPEELPRLARQRGLMQSHEELAIDRGQIQPNEPTQFPRPRSVQEAEGAARYVPQEQANLPPIEPNIEGANVFSTLKAPDPTYNAGSYFWRPDTHEFVGSEGQLGHKRVEQATQQYAKGLIDNYGWVRMTTQRGEYGLDGRTAEAVQNAARDILDTGGDPQATTRFDVGEANVNKPSGEAVLEDVASGRAFGGEKRTEPTPMRQPGGFPRGLAAGERGGIGKPPPEQPGMFPEEPTQKPQGPQFGENVPQGPAAEPPPLELRAPEAKQGAAPLFETPPEKPAPREKKAPGTDVLMPGGGGVIRTTLTKGSGTPPYHVTRTVPGGAYVVTDANGNMVGSRGMSSEAEANRLKSALENGEEITFVGHPEATIPAAKPQYPMQATPENLQRFLEMDHPGAGEPGYQEALDQARRFAESNGITTRSGRPGTETDKGLGQLLGELAKVGEPAPTGPVERTPASVTAEINDLTRQRDATMNNDRSAALDRQIDDLKLERAALEREQRQGFQKEPIKPGETPEKRDLEAFRAMPPEERARMLEGLRKMAGKPEPASRNAELNLEQFDTPQRFARVTLDKIRTLPNEFQARNVEAGKTFTEARVNDIVKNYDPDLMTPLIVAPDPQNPGGFVLLAGHHRLEALRRMGLPADIQIADVNISTPDGLAKARTIADASNLTQHGTTIGERIRAIDRAGTDDVGTIRSMFPALNDQQIRDAIYVRELPTHVVDRLDKLPENSPVTGIAAEVGYGKKAYGFSPDEAEGLFNRLTKTGKGGGKMITRTAARETIDKFGALFAQRQQAGMFEGNADVFGASNRVLDAMDKHARLTRDIETGIRTLTKELKTVEKYAEPGAAEGPKVTAAKAKLADLEAQRGALEDDLLGALKDAEPAGNEAANLSATSTAEARGIARTSSGETPATGTQPPSEIPSTTAEPPSGLTTRNMPPTGALEGGTSTENIAPSVPPEAPPSPVEAAGAPPSPPVTAEAPPTSAPPERPPPRPPTSGIPPVPPEAPPPEAAPPGPPPGPEAPTPPEGGYERPSEGNKFFGDMRPFAEQQAEIKSAQDVGGIQKAVRLALSNIVNPSLRSDAVGKVLTAYQRQRIAGEQLANVGVQAINDVYAQRFTGRNATFHINNDGLIGNVTARVPGASLMWQDVFAHPGDYNLSPKQRAMIGDFIQGFQEIEKVRTNAGLPARAKNRPEGEFYIPHQVEGVRGIEIRRPSDPSLQRIYDLAQEGAAQGIRYSNDPRATLDLHARAAYREVADQQLSDALEPLSLTPSDLVPAGLRAKAEKAGRDLADAQEAILALQRARRGEQIPTSTIGRIERLFPQLENRVQDATEITLQDLYKMSERAKATGERVYKPVTPKLLRDLKKEIGDLEDYVVDHPNDRPAAIRLRELRQQQGFARYRFGIEQDFREQSGMSLGDMLENEETWTRIPRSTRTIIRENERGAPTDYGDAVQTTQGELLKQMISDIRGTPYTDTTAGGNAVTRYRGGYMEAMRNEVAKVRSEYTMALKQAGKTEVIAANREISRKVPGNIKERMATIREKGAPKTTTPAELWGLNQGEDNIAIAQWRNRFFRREDADLLRNNLGAQGLGGPWDYIGRGAELTGGYIRFLATGGDIAAPMTHGLPTFGYNPIMWGRAAASHFFAMLDPAIQARMIRDHMQTAQEMARYGLPAGDTEFFQVLREGGGVPLLQPLEKVPGGRDVRTAARTVGKQTYGRSSVSYSNFLGAARIMLWESMQHLAPAERAQIIRNMTGGLDSAALGVGRRARQFESLWLAFAPKLLRSTVAYMAEARNPFSPTGRIAARSMAGFAAGVVGIYVAAGIAMGRSEDEIRHGLNPLAGKKFLAYKVNGDWIGVGGTVRALVQLASRVATDPKSLLATDTQDNPLAAFYTSRGAVGYTEAELLKEGLDSPPDMAKHLGTAALPFVAQSYVEGQGPTGLIGQELGLRTSRQTPFEALTDARNSAAKRAGYESYQAAVDALGPVAAAKLVGNDQGIAEAQQGMRDNPLRHESEATVPQQEAIDTQLENGQITPDQWRDQRKMLQANEAGRIAVAKRQMGLGDKPTGDPVLDGFYGVFDKFADPETGFVADPNGLQDALDKYTGSLSPEQQTYLDNNTGYSQRDTPKVQEYRADVKKIAEAGYFDAQDAATRAATNGKYQTYGDFIQALTDHARQSGTRPEDYGSYKAIQRMTANAKNNWLAQHPDIDALVDYWYGRKPRTLQAAQELYRQKGIHVQIAAQ